jgi:Tol biopolymer transport system component
MSVSAPPTGPEKQWPLAEYRAVQPHDGPVSPQALIEEARERQRARRRRSVWALTLFAAVVTVIVFGVIGWGRGGSSADGPGVAAAIADSPVAGLITVARLPEVRPGYGPEGWYAVSAVGRAGRLHPIARCPDAARWCGETISAAWSPDGRHLAISTAAFGLRYAHLGLHVIDVATGEDRLILGNKAWNSPACGSVFAAWTPGYVTFEGLAWSPDGDQIAYACGGSIGIVNADGTTPHVLAASAPVPAYSPSWSPNGRKLAFVTGAERPNFEPWMDRRRPTARSIWTVNRDGSNVKLLTNSAIGSPAWAPNGKTIAYQSRCATVQMIQPNGRDVTPKATIFGCAQGLRGKPIWSPDGRQLAIAGEHGLTVVNPDGSNIAHLTDLQIYGTIGPWSATPSWRTPTHPKVTQ